MNRDFMVSIKASSDRRHYLDPALPESELDDYLGCWNTTSVSCESIYWPPKTKCVSFNTCALCGKTGTCPGSFQDLIWFLNNLFQNLIWFGIPKTFQSLFDLNGLSGLGYNYLIFLILGCCKKMSLAQNFKLWFSKNRMS